MYVFSLQFEKYNQLLILNLFQCVEGSGLNVDQVKKCFTSSEGYEMMLKAEKETKAMTPGPLFVPTIVFDDVRVYSIPIITYICVSETI